MMQPAAISLEAVTKHYVTPAGVVRAIDAVTLEIEAGASVAITGPSGCGKSTLLGLMAGLEVPTAGHVSIGGLRISSLPERERARLRRNELGLVFQFDNLQPFLTALENVGLQLALGGGETASERCSELLGSLGLGGQTGKLPDQMSGGERQRVAVARALVNRPCVILADEPTGSLDEESSAVIVDLLLAIQRAAGTTLVVVTHDAAVAARCDGTVQLRDGELDSAGDAAGGGDGDGAAAGPPLHGRAGA
jgi:putative ABC transport system ATP-binding protein